MPAVTTIAALALSLAAADAHDDWYDPDDPCMWQQTSGEWTVLAYLYRELRTDPVTAVQRFIHNPSGLNIVASRSAERAARAEIEPFDEILNERDAMAFFRSVPSRWDMETDTTHYQGQFRISFVRLDDDWRWIARGALTRTESEDLGYFHFDFHPDDRSAEPIEIIRYITRNTSGEFDLEISFTPDQGQARSFVQSRISTNGLARFFGPEATDNPEQAFGECELAEEMR